MKKIIKKGIFLPMATLSLSVSLFSACTSDTPEIKGKSLEELRKIDPTGYDLSTPEDLKVNPNESLSDSIFSIGILVKSGHSHAPENSRQPIGGVMWCTDYAPGNRNFHGNPFDPKSNIPYKREQYIEYQKGADGKYEYNTKYSDTYNHQNIFDLLSTTPRKKYLKGVMYALIVNLYDKNFNHPRIDQLMKLQDSSRVQVFYQVKSVKALRPDKALPSPLQPTDVCYYWYYDRLPEQDSRNKRFYDDGNYLKQTPVGLRGVIQALQPYTQFYLQMSISVLPKGMKKANANSISPSQIQARHIVFQFNIPFRTITSYPLYSEYAYEKMGMDFTNPNFDSELFDKYVEEAKTMHFKDLQYVYPSFSVDSLEKLDEQQKLLMGESSDFVL